MQATRSAMLKAAIDYYYATAVIDDTRALNGCQRVYVAALPKSQATVAKWVEACGCKVARYGWDGVGGAYVDVRGVDTS